MRKRRTHSPQLKVRIAVEVVKGRKIIQEIATDHAIHPIQVSQLKRQHGKTRALLVRPKGRLG